MSVVLSLCLGLALFVAMTSTDARSSMPAQTDLAAAPTQLQMIAGFPVLARYKCVDRWKRCTDFWCDANCNHRPRYCPPSYCRGVPVPPPPAPPPTPDATPSPTTPAPTYAPTALVPEPAKIEKCPAGSLLGTSFFNEDCNNVHYAYKLVCCPAECGTCAGEGCATRPGGFQKCCGQIITKNQKSCDNGAAAPCVLGNPPPDDARGLQAKKESGKWEEAADDDGAKTCAMESAMKLERKAESEAGILADQQERGEKSAAAKEDREDASKAGISADQQERGEKSAAAKEDREDASKAGISADRQERGEKSDAKKEERKAASAAKRAERDAKKAAK